MSGGISAIKGFDYQATVILDRLFDHFDRHGPSAEVRPEGIDDLDLSWQDGAVEGRLFLQIKKPKEDINGNLKPAPWTLSNAITELLPNTFSNLVGNSHQQAWIIGDDAASDLSLLVSAGEDAATTATAAYNITKHRLALNGALNTIELAGTVKKKLRKWKIPPTLPSASGPAHTQLVADFIAFATAEGAGAQFCSHYDRKAGELHNNLPSILSRTKIYPSYGTEVEIRERVSDQLHQRYKLEPSVIENTLFFNLRSFISEISKQPGRKFGQPEFELELVCVWPQMIPIKQTSPLPLQHVQRPNICERFTTQWTGNVIEAIGISGSGKTMLAAEIAAHSKVSAPHRHVLYAEVRPDVALRDVLVGASFLLRRLGISEPFAASTQAGKTDDEVISDLARSYSVLAEEILLIIDFVEGTCNQAFARDIAHYIRSMTSHACRIALLGQESSVRELSELDRINHGVSRIDIRGFSFEEFVKLVAHYHPSPDRSTLFDIHQRITLGRSSGLYAKLAQSLAMTPSLADMSRMAEMPPEAILPLSEQQRFARISSSARGAAEKLVCFALPFRHREAEAIFSGDNVGMAIRELLSHGMLRHHDEDSFEMHETVRAGLEGMIAVNTRVSAHTELASWYGSQDNVAAEILHLEKAGKLEEAKSRAREVFLAGKHWTALSSYVTSHKLVSGVEVIRVVADSASIDRRYLFLTVLRAVGDTVKFEDLFNLLKNRPERIQTDHYWALSIFEAIIEFFPAHLHDLIVFLLTLTKSEAENESAFTWLIIATRQKKIVIEPRTIDLFNRQPIAIKRQLLPLLLLNCHRQVLQQALLFICSSAETEEYIQAPHHSSVSIQISTQADATEFLAAIPQVNVAAILNARSTLLGPLAGLVWSLRKTLRQHCIDIIQNSAMETEVLVNAIRVLVFLAEPSACILCEPLMVRDDAAGQLASFVPGLAPAFCDRARYEAQLVNCTEPLTSRVTALNILIAAGTEIGSLYSRVKEVEKDKESLKAFEFLFLVMCARSPFAEAIPLLEENLSSPGDNLDHIAPLVMTLGRLPTPAATSMLIRALEHKNLWVRKFAITALASRRSQFALASLVTQYRKETNEELVASLAAAIVSSGADAISSLQHTHSSPTISFWKAVLAMRLRDSSFSDHLVNIATDPLQNWQVRRVAIFAAGRLPYEAALERIAPIVLAEHSPLAIDRSIRLVLHSVMSAIVSCGPSGMASISSLGRNSFIDFFSPCFESGDLKVEQGLPTGGEAAGWLFDRLAHHGWPQNQSALTSIVNELSIPLLHSAVLRSFRRCDRPDLIEAQLQTASSIWLAMKCLRERSLAGKRDDALASRLKQRVEASSFKGDELLDRVINEFVPKVLPILPAQAVSSPKQEAKPTIYLSYEDAVQSLFSSGAATVSDATYALKPMDAEQYKDLIRIADPVNDYHRGVETYIPAIRFTENGYVVAQRQVFSSGESPGALLRPVIAATNQFGLPIPWNRELMIGPLSTSYIPKYLACLEMQHNSDQFYSDLEEYGDVIMPHLCKHAQVQYFSKNIDVRIIPMLERYLFSGTDEIFEQLCSIALLIYSPEIDPLLSGLLYRWSQRFDTQSPISQHDNNQQLWRGFNQLAKHPRFHLINECQQRLITVLRSNIRWYHAEDIVRLLEKYPQSYSLIESRLMKCQNWEHFRYDEVDRLDDAAERLFATLLEE